MAGQAFIICGGDQQNAELVEIIEQDLPWKSYGAKPASKKSHQRFLLSSTETVTKNNVLLSGNCVINGLVIASSFALEFSKMKTILRALLVIVNMFVSTVIAQQKKVIYNCPNAP